MAKVLLALLPVVLAHLRGSSPEPGKVPFHVREGHENRSAEKHKWNVRFPGNWSTANLQDYAGRLEHAGFRCVHRGHPSEGGLAFITVEATYSEMEDFVQSQEGPDYVEEDAEIYLIPSVSSTATAEGLVPWNLDRIDGTDSTPLDSQYSPTESGDGVSVYVVDTGIRIDHDDFGGRAHATLESGSDGVTECASSSDPTCGLDEQGHGTHCAGTVGGTSYGVAKKATIHSVKVFDTSSKTEPSIVVAALDWIAANANKPAVVSMSLGWDGQSQIFEDAINLLTQAGVTVVVAAGNDNHDASLMYPANVHSAFTVGATDIQDVRAWFSNYGEAVDIFAPGVSIISADFSSSSGSTIMSGTSMAAPHVAGACALYLQKWPDLQPDELKFMLREAGTQDVIEDVQRSTNSLLHVNR